MKVFLLITAGLVLLFTIMLYLYHSYGVTRDISYGNDPRQKMDLYHPQNALARDTLVVFVYGGAWRSGSKEYYTYMGKYFAQHGYVTLIPNYRLFPQVQFPDFISDIAQAIKKTESLDTVSYTNIVLVGHSAGAHTAALLSIDSSYFRDYDIQKNISGLIGLSGPYDLPLNEELTPIFDTGRTDIDQTNAVTLVADAISAPPILLLHGSDDVRVSTRHTDRFTKALTKKGHMVHTFYLPNYGHIATAIAFLPVVNYFTKASEHTTTFLRNL